MEEKRIFTGWDGVTIYRNCSPKKEDLKNKMYLRYRGKLYEVCRRDNKIKLKTVAIFRKPRAGERVKQITTYPNVWALRPDVNIVWDIRRQKAYTEFYNYFKVARPREVAKIAEKFKKWMLQYPIFRRWVYSIYNDLQRTFIKPAEQAALYMLWKNKYI